ncbi:hypothetical protein LIA77_09688 [Sarocladium implicatum]|nr:hypothetical protein LIA77_09688 [Sarocladium implicatum]
MARFSFPVPGRKKAQPTPAVNQDSSNKAHRLLGSTPLSIDAPGPKGWDNVSNSGISVTVTDAQSPTHPHEQRSRLGMRGPDTDWGDESEVLPHGLRSRYLDPNYDAGSEDTAALRSRTSSSTIKSWYDKSKQPLAVSQQTSASAMARGLPSKAQRMLDMDNSLAPQKMKKKPAKLDLSSLSSSSRSRARTSDGYVLGPDMATKSPSVMSQLSPTSSGDRRRLRKRPTKESLRQRPSISEPIRPSTAESGRFLNHPNGVPDLYGHYEQMSLRQIMDFESHDQDALVSDAVGPMTHATPNPSIIRTSPTKRTPHHAYTPSYSTHSSKPIHHSPSASISSRHTRTSKASKRTETSFLDADLQGKSILSLSSDSEDDESYDDATARSPASVFARRPSDFEEHAASLEHWQPATSSLSQSPSDGRSKNGKHASFAPFHTYLPVPGENSKPVCDKLGSSSSGPSLLQTSSSRISSVSNSSASSAVTWQSNQPGYGVQEARAVTMLPAQGPTDQESPLASGSEWEQPSLPLRPSKPRDSLGSTNDQPTPPLSPSSVDFYIRSAHSSIDGPSGGQNRFMAVSKQEELLLAALRQKRQLMRESFIAEEVSARLGHHSRKSSKGHQVKTSTATITQDLFDFDFPAPPRSKDDVSMSSGDSSAYQPEESSSQAPKGASNEEENTDAILSPAPRRLSSKEILKDVASPRPSERQDEDWPVSPRTLSQFAERPRNSVNAHETRSIRSCDSSLEDHEPILLPRRYSGGLGRRRSSQALPGGGHRSRPSVVPEEPASPPPSGNKQSDFEDAGVPRPDSPISPDAFPAIPTERVTVNKKLARLSAVGSAPLGSQPGWWNDDE